MQTKRCSGCKETKPVSEFCKNRSKKDGLAQYCKRCTNERSRAYYEANKEKVRERHRRWRDDNKKKIAEWGRRYREANKEKVAEKNRRYREINREQETRRVIKSNAESNSRSLELAHRHGLPWEDWEHEFVLSDNGLTIYQKAVKLGRSFRSVQSRRSELRKSARAELTDD